MTVGFDAVDRPARCDCASKCAEFPCPSCPVCAPTGVPNNLPSRPEPVAHIHTPVMVAAACECGERMVWDTQRDELSAIDHNWAAALRRIFA